MTSESVTQATQVANYLLQKIMAWKPNFKPPTKAQFGKWIDDIEKAIRIDGRSQRDLIACIDWIYSPKGEFWRPNILSGRKLRMQFDKIEAQAMMSRGRNTVDMVDAVTKLHENGMTVMDAAEEFGDAF